MFSNDAPSPPKNRLVVITHDRHVVLGRREELDELVLATVGVLELIDKEESKCTS